MHFSVKGTLGFARMGLQLEKKCMTGTRKEYIFENPKEKKEAAMTLYLHDDD